MSETNPNCLDVEPVNAVLPDQALAALARLLVESYFAMDRAEDVATAETTKSV
jgi:hypothetical protein